MRAISRGLFALRFFSPDMAFNDEMIHRLSETQKLKRIKSLNRSSPHRGFLQSEPPEALPRASLPDCALLKVLFLNPSVGINIYF